MKTIFRAIGLVLILTAPNITVEAGAKKPPQEKKTLRVLYWNIQNGMWAGQGDNYQKFVDWINSKDPDICLFEEGATIYYTGTHDHMPNEERYLPAHWGELCARWGHQYHFVVPRRPSESTPYGLSNYPGVITSRYSIDSIKIVKGSKPDSVVVNYSGWYQVHVDGVEKPINIVTVHLRHGKYGYGVRGKEAQAASAARYEGDAYRVKELTCILDGTVRTTEDPNKEFWIMAGDYNSYSRNDNYHYKWNSASLGFQAQDYMIFSSPFFDLYDVCYPNDFLPTCGTLRIDYMYVSKPMIKACIDIYQKPDSYTKREHSGVSTFYIPSDHYPIIADFNIAKMK